MPPKKHKPFSRTFADKNGIAANHKTFTDHIKYIGQTVIKHGTNLYLITTTDRSKGNN